MSRFPVASQLGCTAPAQCAMRTSDGASSVGTASGGCGTATEGPALPLLAHATWRTVPLHPKPRESAATAAAAVACMTNTNALLIAVPSNCSLDQGLE